MSGEDGDLQAQAPFRLLSPVGEATSPLVFASPHSGRLYPKSAGFDPDLSELSLRSAEDALGDRLIEGAPAFKTWELDTALAEAARWGRIRTLGRPNRG